MIFDSFQFFLSNFIYNFFNENSSFKIGCKVVNVARGAREPKRERVALGERKKGDLSERRLTHTHKTSLNVLGPMPWANYLGELL